MRRQKALPVDPTAPPPSSSATPSLRMVTYNINSVNKKRYDLQYLLESTQCDVLALQETLFRYVDWPLRFSGYATLSSMGSATVATRGLALVISTKYGCLPVDRQSPFGCLLVLLANI